MTRRDWKWVSALVLVGLALVGSNIWWFFQVLDQTSITKYLEIEKDQYFHEREILERLCLDLDRTMKKDEVIELFSSIDPEEELFEKHGFLNSTWVSFRFDDNGYLVQIEVDDDDICSHDE